MNLRSLIDDAIKLAHTGGEILPQLEGGAQVAEGILDLLDGLKDKAPDAASKEDLEAAHQALYKRVTEQGHDLSHRLREG